MSSSQYGSSGQAPQDPRQPQSTFQPIVAPAPGGYQQGGAPPDGNSYGQSAPAVGQGGTSMEQQGFQAQQIQSPNMGELSSQMGNMNMGQEGQTLRMPKKRDRHAYHTLDAPASGQAAPPGMAQGFTGAPNQFAGQNVQQQPWQQQQGFASSQPSGQLSPVSSSFAASAQSSAPLAGTPASSTQGKVDPEQIPSVPYSRDAPAQWYLEHIYPTMEQHLPPPASVPFVAVDQGNSSPKYARLTLNNIPASAEALNSTSIPLGLILQPLAPLQDGEQQIPVVDFGETGPPRCRRCRAYINPFMTFRSGGNKYVCNLCTFPNDTIPEYFAPTDGMGVRVDRSQRPELTFGTVEFTAPKEYWTKAPVPMRWLFLIDVSMEAITKGFLEAFCQGILTALYGDESEESGDDAQGEGAKSLLPVGSRIGIATFDKFAYFYNLAPELDKAQMVVMPDMEDPFVPLNDGLFVDPEASKSIIKGLLSQLPRMFSKIKNPEPALLPSLIAALDSLKATGGKIICSLSSLPTIGPGRLFLREKPEMRDTDAEKKLFTTEHPGFMKIAKQMTEHGVGIDFFLAAPQGGYLDIATIGFVSEKTGGELYYYPNFHFPRDGLKISKEIKHTLTRDTGFQALLKVRCSNGLQVSSYAGNFTQHTFGADLEFGVIDADKAFAVMFSYDGKLDSKLDAHFQSALLYTTASGQRRIRCTNIVASVSENALESMKLVDQDAVIGIIAKQSAMRVPERSLTALRAQLTEKTIDILAAYRKNFSGSHPPGQLVLPENLKEFSMYMLGLLKSRALKAGHEPTDRRVFDLRMLKSVGLLELSLYLYPRVIAVHNLNDEDGFPNDKGFLRMPSMLRASYSRVDEGGVYIVDCGQICLLWIHAQVSPNLLEDLFGEGKSTLQSLDAFTHSLPILKTHLNAQVRNILQYLEDNRGSKALTLQLARQGLDGAEYEFARLLFEDRNNEAQSYVDWLVHVHRHIQMELQGQRKKEESSEGSALSSFAGLRAPYW